MTMKRTTALTLLAGGVALPSTWSRPAAAQSPLPVRIAAIGSGGQDEVPYAVQRFGLDKKYGLAMELIDFAAPGQQYTMLRSDSIDVAAGNFVDLLRQR